MNKARLFTLAWTLARKAAVRLSTTARAQFGACLKAAWTILRNSKETVTVMSETVAPEPAPEAPTTAFRGPVVDACVRGGGCGARAWIARITGLHPKFVFERDFVERHDNLSNSGRSGTMWWRLPEPGYYEYRGLQYDADAARIGQLDNCYVEVGEDGVVYVATKAEILAAFEPAALVAA